MSFSDWKKRSILFQECKARFEKHGVGYEEVVQAAYKAGERDGKNRAEAIVEQAIKLRELLRSNV